ncbi:uncharacterized protein AB675_529 [Cyphellophora attinorum]|uniref:ATP-dependent helicase n=1 Tax=Cyphellophora attinorum TaxID=1664694 RepID=A0A0N1HBP7_9EURO|nr:uncharacterized protein AB675_529 [Phialophora attinorum]KPI45664.1 hypothetical protein AB675_529 [Phialophora attinorum]
MDDSPPSKRRKIARSSEATVATHVPLVRQRFHARPVADADYDSLPLDTGLVVRDVEIEGNDGVVVYVKRRKTPKTGKVILSGPSAKRGYKLLKDAQSLPSAISNVDTQLLQACHSASLSKQDDELVLQVELLWCNTTSLWDKPSDNAMDILSRYVPKYRGSPPPALEDWHPRDFYDNLHVPPTDANVPKRKINRCLATLYPFQRRTLRWMLQKEVATVPAATLSQGFLDSTDADMQPIYVNHTLGVVSTNLGAVAEAFAPPRGGILAEEMGLGKTLAVIATVCSHPRPDMEVKSKAGQPRKSAATLIVTPVTLLDQWREEIAMHSTLNVVAYEGIATARGKKTSFQDHVDTLAEGDIVLCSYNTLSREIHHVNAKPDRSRRHQQVYETPKSPLTEISWWRVCLDEAQMVESGVSNAATVARQLPREIAWAVTGTPLRQGHKDLFGLMLFLNFQPWGWSARLWDRLISYHRPLFKSMIGTIAIRHTKDLIRGELTLPPQSRNIVSLPFTAIEEQHYDNLFDEMCNAVGLRADGSPRSDDWDPEDPRIVEEMRRWLSRLRQTCLHPEVGARNRRALGRGGGPLRTVGQVLDVMIDQVDGTLHTEQRAVLMSKIRRGQMLENAKRPKEALGLWNAAYDEATSIVNECQQRLNNEQKLYEAAKAVQQKQAENSDHADKDEEDESDSALLAHRQRLRSALEVQHICIFFAATAYFQLKSDTANVEPESEEFHALEKRETEGYDIAKRIRGQLLVEVLKKANPLIQAVSDKANAPLPAALQEIVPHGEYSGIETRTLFNKFYRLCEALNEQSKHYQTVRSKMVDFLKGTLIDDDTGIELQGDEYEASTKHQDELYVYVEALRILFADRNEALTGLQNMLITHEVKGFLRHAREGEGPAPDLMIKALAERLMVRIDTEKHGSLRGLVAEIRALIAQLPEHSSDRARAERHIAERLLEDVQKVASNMSKALPHLEQEVTLFTDTMNSRLGYYAALQKISDAVAPYEEERIGQPLEEAKFNDTLAGEQRASIKISTSMSKRRYLLHLKDESTKSTPRICTICQTEFEIGTLTVCGHQFCKDCIQLWWKERRNCPVCKRHLRLNDFHDITYKPAEMTVQPESPASSSTSRNSTAGLDAGLNRSIYSDVSTATLNEIKNTDLTGAASFGSKIDTICRHIIWLREHDYGTKSVIFSQYRDFLDVLSRAFRQHNIHHTSFEQPKGIHNFKTEPGIECFLLHAKNQSAGLNLVCASHVLLCEPLLATAVELQAIARVHRIGQHQATTVWMYIIGGTVEESIYNLSVAKRLEHIKRNVKKVGKAKADGSLDSSGAATPKLGENLIDAANSLELQDADMKKLLTTGKTGGEFVDKGDLWQCLFGKTRRKERVMHSANDKPADEEGAGGEIGRFLRAEAAESRAASND